MRIVTWNINSVRLRIETLLRVMKETKADVVCLQETKTPDEHFPMDAVRAAGFGHAFISGMKGYNGVAILSRLPLEKGEVHKRCGKADSRHVSATVAVKGRDPVEIHNIYIPAGGYEPDPVINDKFQHKLDFVDELAEWFPERRSAKKPMVVLGDLNIAPLENDVWDHRKMLDVVSHTPVEVEKFTRFYRSMKWVDAIRHFVPEEEKLFSWWSYRAEDWEKADKGRRLDHIWVTEPLKKKLAGQRILKSARGWDRPSDHAPVVLDLDPTG